MIHQSPLKVEGLESDGRCASNLNRAENRVGLRGNWEKLSRRVGRERESESNERWGSHFPITKIKIRKNIDWAYRTRYGLRVQDNTARPSRRRGNFREEKVNKMTDYAIQANDMRQNENCGNRCRTFGTIAILRPQLRK